MQNIQKQVFNAFLMAIFGLFTTFVDAQSLAKTLTLKMPTGEGNNGAQVVWHPKEKKYYAAYAGNTEYVMAVFDETGKCLSSNNLTTQADLRGLWYYPKTKKLQGNCYADGGWVTYNLDKDGIPTKAEVFAQKPEDLGDQVVGSYDAKADKLYFFTEGSPSAYDLEGKKLILKKKKEVIADFSNIIAEERNTTILYTGRKKEEIIIHNYNTNQIEFYNKAAELKKSLSLPAKSPNNGVFNFAYSNGFIWLFDKAEKCWYGYLLP